MVYSNFLLSLFIVHSLDSIWSMINTLQILSLNLLLGVSLPRTYTVWAIFI